MSTLRLVLATALVASLSLAAAAQRYRPPSPNDFFRYNPQATLPAHAAPGKEEPPVVTHHQITLDGRALAYTAYTGLMPIRNATTGAVEGNMFYVYYAKDGVTDLARRPMFFIFNGGPGSSSVWLHMGAFGPEKIALLPNGAAPPPPYHFEDNPNTLLDQADMVFIDPVGTGYSRPADPKLGAKFWGVENDVASVGEFIRMFLVRYDRWPSPKFLAGESYGTLRAAALSGYLAEHGVALNGVVLISTIINEDAHGGDMRYVSSFPTDVMTAWYHHRLGPDLEKLSASQVAREAEQFAATEYLSALYQGARLSPADRDKTVADMARLTGLSPTFIANNDLRISLGRFSTQLLRDQHLITGRLDSRFTSYATDGGAEETPFDPSDANIENSFPPVFQDYVQKQLGYKSDAIYYILGGGIGPWSGAYQVTPQLEEAFARNPNMHLFVAMGYYDFATVYYAVEWTLAHLHVSPQVREHNITTDHFEAGHMVYIDARAMRQLRGDLRAFITAAAPRS